MKIRGKKDLLEQTLLVMVAGLCAALEEGSITIGDAEYLLFSPRTMSLLRHHAMSTELVELIHDGTELEDIASLIPTDLANAIRKLKEAALAQLAPLPQGAVELRSWLVDCLEREPVDADSGPL